EARLASAKDVAAALKREPGCETKVACAAAAASHAGARQLIMGTTSQLGDSFMVDLKLIDARSGQELRRATHPVSGAQEALIEKVREAAIHLIAPSRFVGALRVEVPGAAGAQLYLDGKPAGTLPLSQPLEGLAPGQHAIRVKDKTQETSTFVEVRFGRTTDAQLDLGAAPVVAVPAAALPVAIATGLPRKPAWVRPAAIAAIGAGVASAVIGVAFNARAGSTTSSSSAVAPASQLQGPKVQTFIDGDPNAGIARGFYLAAAVLAATGGGLLWWDVQTDSIGLTTHF
ncbi:MAG TPA: hypothetical protein VE755_09985, partial [Myxococcales bacterium]|nr:hypothetical protein [Myxococcales bacterium]